MLLRQCLTAGAIARCSVLAWADVTMDRRYTLAPSAGQPYMMFVKPYILVKWDEEDSHSVIAAKQVIGDGKCDVGELVQVGLGRSGVFTGRVLFSGVF